MMQHKNIVVVRGGGDLATGTIFTLHQAGFCVLVLETDRPTAIRRSVAVSEAVYEQQWTVEGVTAVLIENDTQTETIWKNNQIPILIDADCNCLKHIKPSVVVDAILAKKNLGTTIDMADTVIALGPGFTAGIDAHIVIETKRGHDLGRILTQGQAAKNTGIPGIIAGYGKERVIHAPESGILHTYCTIGERVKKGQVIAKIDNIAVEATIDGILRGILRDGFFVHKGLKMADIDPREQEQKNCYTISDKARCIAGSVLTAILMRG